MAMKMRKKQKSKVKAVIKKASATPTKTTAQAEGGAVAQNFTIPKTKYVEGIGRRKVATARVRIYEGAGDFVVNDQIVGQYFSTIRDAASIYRKPFELTGTKDRFAVTVKVSGSGVRAQLEAVVHGLSRALVAYNPEFKIFLKSAGLLTRDDRMKETRKVGMGGKARRQRQSPKR